MSDEVTAVVLEVAPDASTLRVGETVTRQVRLGRQAVLDEALNAMRRVRDQRTGDDRGVALIRSQEDLGLLLGRQFAARSLGAALRDAITEAISDRRTVRLCVEASDSRLSDLPWELLRLPGMPEPLALLPGVEMFRRAAQTSPAAPTTAAGPLRILVVVAAPTGVTASLDYEAETNHILDAVAPARRAGHVEVEIVPWGSPAQIRQALERRPFQILHISSHARAGRLQLEDDAGGPHAVGLVELAELVRVGDRTVPLVVLAGCSTAQGRDPVGIETIGLANGLLTAGVPAVLAMTAAVSDLYSIQFCTEFYAQLGRSIGADILGAVSDARYVLEIRRRALPTTDRRSLLIEWATPALFLADATGPAIVVGEDDDATTPTCTVVNPFGGAVGRREELRLVINQLSPGAQPFAVAGVAGIGKTTLVRSAFTLLPRQPDLVVRLDGAISADAVVHAIREEVVGFLRAGPACAADIVEAASAALSRPGSSWDESLRHAQPLFAELDVVLWLDSFEANCTGPRLDVEIEDGDLRSVLRALADLPAGPRIVITSRLVCTLPFNDTTWFLIGPLGHSELRKLEMRLPAVDELDLPAKHLVRRSIGGHPGGLARLDALMRSGTPLDDAVPAVCAQLIRDASINALVDRLRDMPAHRELLGNSSVLRRPLEPAGLLWMTMPDDPLLWMLEFPLDPKRWERLLRSERSLAADLPAEARDAALRMALGLCGVGLMAPVADGQSGAFAVHPWITPGIGLPETDLEHLHRRAAAYWHLRTVDLDSSPAQRSAYLAEAAAHLAEVRDWPAVLDHVMSASGYLATDGDTTAAAELCQAWIPQLAADPGSCASLCRHAALYSEFLGRYPEAEAQLQAAIDLHRAAGDGREESARQLAIRMSERRSHPNILPDTSFLSPASQRFIELVQVAFTGMDYASVEREVEDHLGSDTDPAIRPMAMGLLGAIASRDGRTDLAIRWFQAMREASLSGGDPGGATSAVTLLALTVDALGDHGHAREMISLCVRDLEEVGDQQNAARCLIALGQVALRPHDNDEAALAFEQARVKFERAGDERGVADALTHLGETSSGAEAVAFFERALNLYESFRDTRTAGELCGRLAVACLDLGEDVRAAEYHDRLVEAAAYADLRDAIKRHDYEAAWIHVRQHRWATARDLFARTADRGRRLRIPRLEAIGLAGVAHVARECDEHETAETLYRQVRHLAQRAGDHTTLAGADNALAFSRIAHGDHEAARELLNEVLEICRTTSIPHEKAEALRHLGSVAELTGAAEEAVTWYVRSIDEATRNNMAHQAVYAMERLAKLHALPGEHPEADTLPWSLIESLDFLAAWHREAKRYDNALAYAKRLFDLGAPYAAAQVANLTELTGDLTEARRLWGKLAGAGDPDGMFQLGRLAEHDGNPVAAFWFARAARAGHGQSRQAWADMMGEPLPLASRETVDPDDLRITLTADDTHGTGVDYTKLLPAIRRVAATGATPASLMVGLIHESQGELVEAERWYLMAALLGDASGAGRLAQLLLGRAEADAANPWLACIRTSGDADAMEKLGVFYARRGTDEEAEHWLTAAFNHGALTAARYLCRLSLVRQDTEAAIRWINAAEADDMQAMTIIGQQLMDVGRAEEAIAWWQRAAEAGDRRAAALAANEQLRRGNLRHADAPFDAAATLNDVNRKLSRADRAARSGDHTEARRLWAEVSDHPLATINLGIDAIRRGDLAEASGWAERLSGDRPAEAAALRARIHVESGDLDQAETMLADSGPFADAPMWASIGWRRAASEDFDGAARCFAAACRLGDPAAAVWLTAYHLRTGRWYEALRYARKGLRSRQPEAIERVAAILDAAGARDSALYWRWHAHRLRQRRRPAVVQRTRHVRFRGCGSGSDGDPDLAVPVTSTPRNYHRRT